MKTALVRKANTTPMIERLTGSIVCGNVELRVKVKRTIGYYINCSDTFTFIIKDFYGPVRAIKLKHKIEAIQGNWHYQSEDEGYLHSNTLISPKGKVLRFLH